MGQAHRGPACPYPPKPAGPLLHRPGTFDLILCCLLAWTVGDMTKVPFSDDITPDSALLMRRNIRERTAALAPFLSFDDDPYLMIGR